MSAALSGQSLSNHVPENPSPGPTTQSERITALDTLRGFALLGILLMNIVDFGLYYEAYNNPTSAGGATGANLWTWAILSVLAEGKMRCLFSVVFGASMILLTSRLEGRADAADIYYRRLVWLMIFGIAHAFLLWHGEVLYYYAICALILYPFRKLRPGHLVMVAVFCVLLTSGYGVLSGYWKRQEIRDGKAAAAKAERKETLTDEEQEARLAWEKAVKDRNPSPEALQKDAEGWRGNVFEVIKARGSVVLKWHSVPYYHAWNFDVWGMMFLGMALYKSGVLTGARSVRFYTLLALLGYGLGIPIGIYKTAALMNSNFDPATEAFTGTVYDLQRLLVALGHAALLLILCRRGWLSFLTTRLAAVGQMALTNYVTHSVICAFFFTGYGLAMYNRLERHQLYYVVAVIWIFQLIISPIWLKHFRFGPLEWCWRAVTYLKRPRFRRIPALAPAGPAVPIAV